MSGDTNETEAEADRLEAALERIARYTASHPAPAAATMDDGDEASPESEEIATRLDALIDKLRSALAARPH